MPFGLCNAPTTFQCLMQNTLGELNLTYCVIYLDDVIVFGHTEEEHLECLHVVFQPEVETLQVFVFPVQDCIPGTSCFLQGDPPQ